MFDLGMSDLGMVVVTPVFLKGRSSTTLLYMLGALEATGVSF